jgi:hypothetical protein
MPGVIEQGTGDAASARETGFHRRIQKVLPRNAD